MSEDAKAEVLKIIDKIDDPEIKDNVNQAIMNDPYLELRISILEFIKYRLDKIKKGEDFKAKIQNSLSEDMEQDKLNSQDKIALYEIVCKENTVAVDSLLNLFRSKTGDSVFAEKKTQIGSDNIGEAFKNLTTEQWEKIDKFTRFFIDSQK